MDLTLTAVLLGIVEGVTEFVPVSSTGHLILASELFGYDAEQWKVFNVVIQLGAILAVVVHYWRTFWAVGIGLWAASARAMLSCATSCWPSCLRQYWVWRSRNTSTSCWAARW